LATQSIAKEIDGVTLRHLTTKFGCLKNGKELTDEEIEDLDDQHGAKLFGAIQEFNGQRPLVP